MFVLRSLGFALLAMVALGGCDIVEDPTPPSIAGGGGEGAADVPRKVLLEDITGHHCNNCPSAARIALALKENLYHEDLVLVGVHAGSFAPPWPPVGDGEYDTDHRTVAGTAYQQAYQITFFPAGLISRRSYANSIIVSEGSWSSAVADIIGQPSPFELWIDTITVNGTGVSTVVKVRFAENVEGDHHLVVYLTEDHVIDWQLDSEANPPDVPNYDHRHMLRANLNGTWGEQFVFGNATAGDTATVTIDNFALNPAWNTANCALVAWVRNTVTDEVMQVEERKLQP